MQCVLQVTFILSFAFLFYCVSVLWIVVLNTNTIVDLIPCCMFKSKLEAFLCIFVPLFLEVRIAKVIKTLTLFWVQLYRFLIISDGLVYFFEGVIRIGQVIVHFAMRTWKPLLGVHAITTAQPDGPLIYQGGIAHLF